MRGIKRLFDKLHEKSIDIGTFFYDHKLLSNALHFLHMSWAGWGLGKLAGYIAGKFGIFYAGGLMASGPYGILILLAACLVGVGYEFVVRTVINKILLRAKITSMETEGPEGTTYTEDFVANESCNATTI